MARLPRTSVPGFHISPLRSWIGDEWWAAECAIRVFFRPFGAYRSATETHGLRRGLHSPAATRLIAKILRSSGVFYTDGL
jgi:hypothetical protein